MTRNYPSQPQYSDLGKLITRLTQRLKVLRGGTMQDTMVYIGKCIDCSSSTIYRLQQGHSRPILEKVEILARIGREEAKLDREWGESLLTTAGHQDVATIADRIWGGRVIHSIPYNLPPLKHTKLVGRDNEIAHLLRLLSYERGVHFIPVQGMGGVGKTALVLEVAYRCWDASTGKVSDPETPTFEAIIFVSAKQQSLFPAGIQPIYRSVHRTLREICHEVARVLEHFDITRSPSDEDQLYKMRIALARQSTLLIVDNLETMENQAEVVSFLYEELPPTVKAVTTSREQTTNYHPIRLGGLAEEDALNLIGYLAQEHGVAEKVVEEHARGLWNRIGGIPAAFVYAIGQVALGDSIETVLDRVANPDDDVARFVFAPSFEQLRRRQAHYLLMAIAMFPKRPLVEAVAYTVGVTDPKAIDAGLQLLRKINFVTKEEDRYSMLPLTREYTLAELGAYPEFEEKARERWIGWHLKFAEKHGGHDWKDWHIQYDQLEEEWDNFLAVFEWCARHDRYNEIRSFWQTRSEVSVLEFTDTYGYWDDRLFWLSWLVQAAQQRGDRETAIEAMGNAGFILTLMGRLGDAKEQFSTTTVVIKAPESLDESVA